MALDILLILPATHAFREMFLKLCANLGSHFCDMEYVMFLGKCKSFILSNDHRFRSYGSQVVTEHDQTEALSSFVSRDTCIRCGLRADKILFACWVIFHALTFQH